MNSPALGIDAAGSQITGAPRGSACSAGLAGGFASAIGMNITYLPSVRSEASHTTPLHNASPCLNAQPEIWNPVESRHDPTRVTSSYPSTCSSMCCPTIFRTFLGGALLNALGCARLLYTRGIFGASTGGTLNYFASLHYGLHLKCEVALGGAPQRVRYLLKPQLPITAGTHTMCASYHTTYRANLLR